MNSFVDVIRTSGIRAKIAKRRDEEFPDLDFDSWMRSWHLLRWKGLLKAVERRAKGDRRILIAYSIDNKQPENCLERLTFIFLTKPNPSRIEQKLLY